MAEAAAKAAKAAITHIPQAAALADAKLEDWGKVAHPVGEPVVRLAGLELVEGAAEGGRDVGIWQATPGKWQRDVMAAEFCHFVSGHAFFHAEDGRTIEIRAGDAVYFPPNSRGTWEVRETLRKIYVMV